MQTYCDTAPTNPFHKAYHDHVYGFPVTCDHQLFGRLILEINQAGLSWLTILKKQEAFEKAFDHYDVAKVAQYGEVEYQRLLADASIIRNKLKIKAVIYNAQQIVNIQKQYGSFYQWLVDNYCDDLVEWVKLFKTVFKFTGGEITREFLTSIGFIEGAHVESCSVYEKILEAKPLWVEKKGGA